MGWHRHLFCLDLGYMLDTDLSHESYVTGLSSEVSSYNWGIAPCQFSRWVAKQTDIISLFRLLFAYSAFPGLG